MTLSSGFSSAARSGQAPLQVTLRRGTISESVHRVHAVVCDGQGRVLLSAGDAGFETFIRSALKPFQALPFLSSGAADQMDVGERGIAISCASHAAPISMRAKRSSCFGTVSYTHLTLPTKA